NMDLFSPSTNDSETVLTTTLQDSRCVVSQPYLTDPLSSSINGSETALSATLQDPRCVVSQSYLTDLLYLSINGSEEASQLLAAKLKHCQDESTCSVKWDGEILVSFSIKNEAKGSNGYIGFRGKVVNALKQKGDALYKDLPAVSR